MLRRLKKTLHWFHLVEAFYFLLFTVLVILSNHNDWDFFFSTMEVDLRSWLVDHQAPYWSYQLCAGSTRAGDPQAFGLSPLFVIPLALGSFWGAKALALLLTVVGYSGLTRLLSLAAPAGKAMKDDQRLVYASLSFFLLCGNYYVGHVHGGQLTFLLLPLSFFILQLLLRGFRERLSQGSLFALFVAVLSYFTGGFYHSLVFFFLPITILCFLALALRAARRKLRFQFSPAVLAAPAVALLGLACASYKWLEVLHYQAVFPRTLEPVAEISGLSHLLVYFFVPTFQLRFGGLVEFLGPWGAGEYSAFGFLPFGFAAAAVWLFRSRNSLRGKDLWLPELSLCALLALLLCLGDSSPIPIHHFLNHFFYHDSVRVIGRYHVLLLFLAAAFLARLGTESEAFRRFYLRWLLPAGAVLSGISLLSFFPMTGTGKFFYTAFSPITVNAEMTRIAIAPSRLIMARSDSFMYNHLKSGAIVLNCYQPLSREVRVAGEQGFVNPAIARPELEFGILSAGKTPVTDACRESAYVTQNEVFFDAKSCPPDLCFLLNAQNPFRTPKLIFNQERKLYCLR